MITIQVSPAELKRITHGLAESAALNSYFARREVSEKKRPPECQDGCIHLNEADACMGLANRLLPILEGVKG